MHVISKMTGKHLYVRQSIAIQTLPQWQYYGTTYKAFIFHLLTLSLNKPHTMELMFIVCAVHMTQLHDGPSLTLFTPDQPLNKTK